MPEVRAWVPMSDGIRLAATLFLPDREGPWPVILEALPYRKDDQTQSYWDEYRRLRDEGGYAVARVDLRGTGSSEGLAADEYLPLEQRDLCEVIDWLAGQGWCTGAVGMYGASYSGFNSLQVAVERPAALKAIIAIYATDDRYHDDVHYWGGTRRALDFVDYPTYMVAMNALPPVPEVFGDGWREEWQRRVEGLTPWVVRWVEEQTDGPYWRHGSLGPDYRRVGCPVMLIGGWADGYRNATLRVMERLRVPRKLLMGPWSHRAAEASLPGPRIDWVPDMVRWWDRWLRDLDNGIDREPMISVFVRRSTKPAPDLDDMRGEWRYEGGWPLERGREIALELATSLAPAFPGRTTDELDVRGDVGVHGSISCAGHLPFGQPMDQRPDEARSLVYDWPELEDEVEVLGSPRLEITVRSSAPVAFLSAKLCDVFPDGTSTLVSRGFLNLTHRASHSEPEPLVPGRAYAVTVPLDTTSWVFERGHRIRLDVAGADWPNVWPPPEPVSLSVERRGSRLVLPVVPGPPAFADPPTFAPPRAESAPTPTSHEDLETRPGVRGSAGTAPEPVWRLEHDVLGRQTRVLIEHGAENSLEGGGISTERYRGETGVSTDDPGAAWARGQASFTLEWPDAAVGAEARTVLRSDAEAWHLEIELDVTESGSIRWQRRWERQFPRYLA
jgi:putative CocE/NonD family hydrolase